MTRAELVREVEAGRITKEDRVELLAGRIVDVMTEGSTHAFVVDELVAELHARLPRQRWRVRQDHPVALSELDEPEPDIVVATGRADGYRNSHPSPDEVVLVIEVAQSSQRRDRVLKAERYALAGIRDYWVVDLIDEVTVVHRSPSVGPAGEGSYGSVEVVPAGTAIRPLLLGEVALTPLA